MRSPDIENQAIELLNRHDMAEAPIDVYGIIDKEAIVLSFEDMEDDHSGLLLVEKGVATIAINNAHHTNRQRFSAAHELGHYVLHSRGHDRLFVDKAYRRSKASSAGLDIDEIEANRFAASLLMPCDLIRRHVGSNPIMDLDIYRLALRFEVSEQAMTLRLVKLKHVTPQ